MTKKDFQLIANVIATCQFDGCRLERDDARLLLAGHFADILATTNPLFKRGLFLEAATGQVSVTARKVRTLASDLIEDR